MNDDSIDSEIKKIADKIFNENKQKFEPEKTHIKYAGMIFDKKEIHAAIKALAFSFANNWFPLGSHTKEFQIKLASYLGLKKSIFVNSGSSANLISVASLAAKSKIKRGDEAITLSATFPTTLNPILIYGLKPVLVDIILPSYSSNLDEIEKAVTKKTKLIMLPHINGSPHDMQRIMEIARKHGLYVVEDCCDALGSKFNGKTVGTYGNLGTFSFYAAHHISTGEGGALATNDEELISTAESIRDWGRMNLKPGSSGNRKISLQNISKELPEDYEDRYTYINIGYNLKPIDMQAAMGLQQLEKLDNFTLQRKRNYKFLFENLSEFDDKLLLPEGLPKADPSWFVFPISVKRNSGFKRFDIIQFLEKKKIETRSMLAGDITKHPAYKDIKFHKVSKLKTTKEVLENSFVIGVFPGLGNKELEYVVECFHKFFRAHG